MEKSPEQTNIAKAIEVLGGPSAAARILGLRSHSVVQGWRNNGRVPAEYCPAIERYTAGAVTCEQLRPSVDWTYIRGSAPGA